MGIAKLIQLGSNYPVFSPEDRALAYMTALKNKPKAKPVGSKEVTKFIAQHLEFRSKLEQHLEIKHISASSSTIVHQWFETLDLRLARIEVDPRKIWDMDVIGFQRNNHQFD